MIYSLTKTQAMQAAILGCTINTSGLIFHYDMFDEVFIEGERSEERGNLLDMSTVFSTAAFTVKAYPAESKTLRDGIAAVLAGLCIKLVEPESTHNGVYFRLSTNAKYRKDFIFEFTRRCDCGKCSNFIAWRTDHGIPPSKDIYIVDPPKVAVRDE